MVRRASPPTRRNNDRPPEPTTGLIPGTEYCAPIPRQDLTVQPEENETHGMERQPTLGQQISAHTNRPHKGDVGRLGTNEEVFQGSKGKELK